jgi:hypothetical protein
MKPNNNGDSGGGFLKTTGAVLAIVVALITILQFAGIAKVQCLWSSCESSTSPSSPATITTVDHTHTVETVATPTFTVDILAVGNWSGKYVGPGVWQHCDVLMINSVNGSTVNAVLRTFTCDAGASSESISLSGVLSGGSMTLQETNSRCHWSMTLSYSYTTQKLSGTESQGSTSQCGVVIPPPGISVTNWQMSYTKGT